MKKYKLYRTLYDIIHPSISRKNITNYNIIINEKLLPLQIYYPKKEVNISKMIIYIADRINNNNVYSELAKRTDNLVLVIENNNNQNIDDYYNTINYIYNNISTTGINNENITIMSDYNGTNIENEIFQKSIKNKSFIINKLILLGPNFINKNKKTNELIILDKDKEEDNYIKVYLKKFIQGNDLATNERVFNLINDFLN